MRFQATACADRVPGCRRPVGAGFVDSLARAGGNATGFMTFEYSIEWLELLKQIALAVTRVAVLRDPATSTEWASLASSGRGAVAQGG